MSPAPNAASVAIFSGSDVLLIKRAMMPYAGYWTLPGGRLETGERAEDCARREIFEEVGLILGELAAVLTMEIATGYRLAVFASTFPGGRPSVSSEIADWRWAGADALARMQTTPGLADILTRAFAQLTE